MCSERGQEPAKTQQQWFTQHEDLWAQETYLPWDLLQALSQDDVCIVYNIFNLKCLAVVFILQWHTAT